MGGKVLERGNEVSRRGSEVLFRQARYPLPCPWPDRVYVLLDSQPVPFGIRADDPLHAGACGSAFVEWPPAPEGVEQDGAPAGALKHENPCSAVPTIRRVGPCLAENAVGGDHAARLALLIFRRILAPGRLDALEVVGPGEGVGDRPVRDNSPSPKLPSAGPGPRRFRPEPGNLRRRCCDGGRGCAVRGAERRACRSGDRRSKPGVPPGGMGMARTPVCGRAVSPGFAFPCGPPPGITECWRSGRVLHPG